MRKQKIREKIYIGAQIVLLILLLIYINGIFATKSGSNKPFQSVANPIVKQAEKIGLQKADTQTIKRLYKVNAQEYDGFALYTSTSPLDVDEVLIVKAKDDLQAESLKELAAERIDTQIKTFEGYGVEQTKRLKGAILDVRGRYVFMVVSKDAQKLAEIFENSL